MLTRKAVLTCWRDRCRSTGRRDIAAPTMWCCRLFLHAGQKSHVSDADRSPACRSAKSIQPHGPTRCSRQARGLPRRLRTEHGCILQVPPSWLRRAMARRRTPVGLDRRIAKSDPPQPRQRIPGRLPWVAVGLTTHFLEVGSRQVFSHSRPLLDTSARTRESINSKPPQSNAPINVGKM